MEASYAIYPEARLVVYKVIGQASWPKLRELWQRVSVDPAFDPSFDGLGDWRSARHGLARAEIYEMAEFVRDNEITNGTWVVLVEEPMITAFAMIYRERIGNLHGQEVCCTVEGASRLLDRDVEPYLL